MRFAVALLALVVPALVACGSASPQPVVISSPLNTAQLKFAVLDAVGKPVYCDPDFYPLERPGGELASAIARYAEIKGDSQTYAAIVAHEHLPSGDLTDEQKLTLYRAWKLLNAVPLVETYSGQQSGFRYRVQSKSGSAAYEMVDGLVRIDGVVTVSSRMTSGPPNCPICLAASTLIATPKGPVRVTDVRAAMTVWTQAPDGSRVAAPVIEVGSMEAPVGHLMVHLVLADGRELLVSPGHKTADGRPLGTLKIGDGLDGATVTSWSLVPYAGERTYDILPAGATGLYWANGILLASTLGTSR